MGHLLCCGVLFEQAKSLEEPALILFELIDPSFLRLQMLRRTAQNHFDLIELHA